VAVNIPLDSQTLYDRSMHKSCAVRAKSGVDLMRFNLILHRICTVLLSLTLIPVSTFPQKATGAPG
jgi:hypothetical protein